MASKSSRKPLKTHRQTPFHDLDEFDVHQSTRSGLKAAGIGRLHHIYNSLPRAPCADAIEQLLKESFEVSDDDEEEEEEEEGSEEDEAEDVDEDESDKEAGSNMSVPGLYTLQLQSSIDMRERTPRSSESDSEDECLAKEDGGHPVQRPRNAGFKTASSKSSSPAVSSVFDKDEDSSCHEEAFTSPTAASDGDRASSYPTTPFSTSEEEHPDKDTKTHTPPIGPTWPRFNGERKHSS